MIENLSDYVQKVYGFTITVIVSSVKCTNFKAIYEVEIISTSLAEVLPLLLNDLNNTEGLYLGNFAITLCSMECEEVQSTTFSNKEEAKILPTHLILIILLIIFTIILMILIIYNCHRLVIFITFITYICFTILDNFLQHGNLVIMTTLYYSNYCKFMIMSLQT